MFPERIVILGCSGSGKSTLAEALARRIGTPYVPSDHIYWTGDWNPASSAAVRAWVDDATSAGSWVLDGNFDAQRDLVWQRAELAVWLDLPLFTTVWRVFCRNFRWWMTGEEIWGNKRMTLRRAWSGVRHTLRSHSLKRRTYPQRFAEFPHLRAVRLTSSRQIALWLEGTGRARMP